MTESRPFRTTRYMLPALVVTDSGTIYDNVVTGGYIWQQGRNRAYYQNLNYSTLASATPSDIGSVTIAPLFSGHIIIDASVRSNNNVVNNGIYVYLYAGTSTLIRETYQSEPVAGNEMAFPVHYELKNQQLYSTLIIGIKHAVVSSGAVVSRVIGLIAEEI